MNKKIQNAIKKYKDACNLLASIVKDKLFDGCRDWYLVCDEECEHTQNQEHESDDLEESASMYAKEEYSRKNPATLPNMCIGCYAPIINAFRNGAKWKEQHLMANAVDGVVHHFEKCKVASVHYNDPTGVPMAYFTSQEGLSEGDKVKIIVINED